VAVSCQEKKDEQIMNEKDMYKVIAICFWVSVIFIACWVFKGSSHTKSGGCLLYVYHPEGKRAVMMLSRDGEDCPRPLQLSAFRQGRRDESIFVIRDSGSIDEIKIEFDDL
jgi:hypothetical protein